GRGSAGSAGLTGTPAPNRRKVHSRRLLYSRRPCPDSRMAGTRAATLGSRGPSLERWSRGCLSGAASAGWSIAGSARIPSSSSSGSWWGSQRPCTWSSCGMEKIREPEREMVARALLPGAASIALAFVLGLVFAGAGEAWSAAIGVAVALANFVASAELLAWAATVSLAAVQLVVLVGFIVRLAIIVGLMFALSVTSWFSPLAFGLAVAPAWLLLFAYEAILLVRTQAAVPAAGPISGSSNRSRA